MRKSLFIISFLFICGCGSASSNSNSSSIIAATSASQETDGSNPTCPQLITPLLSGQSVQGPSSDWRCQSNCDAVPFNEILFYLDASTAQNPYGLTEATTISSSGHQIIYILDDSSSHTIVSNGNLSMVSYSTGTHIDVSYLASLRCNNLNINGAIFEFISSNGGY